MFNTWNQPAQELGVFGAWSAPPHSDASLQAGAPSQTFPLIAARAACRGGLQGLDCASCDGRCGGLQGLGGDNVPTGYLTAPAKILWGGNIVSSLGRTAMLRDLLQRYLEQNGQFDYVDVQQQSGFTNPYFNITAITSVDHAQSFDVLNELESLIRQTPNPKEYADAGVPLAVESMSRNFVQIIPGPNKAPANSSAAAVLATPWQNVPANNATNSTSPNKSNSLTQWLDDVASSLGISRTTAMIVGALAGVVVIVAVGKAVR